MTVYLPDEEMERLADAVLIVDGVRLPVHSAVLSQQSRVLRGLFVDLMAVTTGTNQGRKHEQPEGPVVLEQPFADCRLQEVTAFLRCAYHGSLASGLPSGCLPGVLSLAHRLDAPEIMDAVSARIRKAADSGTATTKELLAWADAADTCHMDELCVSCVAEVARQLAADLDRLPAGGDSLLSIVTHTSLLEGCSHRSLLLLLRIMTAAGRKPQLSSCIPSKDEVVLALQRAVNPGSFEWALERFSEQPAAVGKKVVSPWFAAAGKEWRISVYPGGATDAASGHLAVYLVANSPVHAKFKLTVVDQSGAASQSVTLSVHEPMEISPEGWGWAKFMTLEQLRTRGFLANDRLVVRAEVEVVPE